MKRLIAAFLLLAASLGAHAQQADAGLTRVVNVFMDEWHDDAAHARMAYFDKIAPDGVYIGTDKHELWHRDEFKAWADKFFKRGSAWSFKAVRRNVYASSDGKYIWFDEILDTPNMGPCMASGVIRKTAKGFEILHYQLSFAVPNELAGQVTKLVKEFESKADAKR
ncbi:nuclear transport factor 2 family protein [Massilia agilis]|uniref:Nuclear transport factor 2 family protein n=1 Tax=Massilia agilis TaxID=1811226 RepID=A0ABT2D753_9BURK|nr:nuclear transport factor 2 family protein [Massilia agilis]MCS0807147.1 nuclear transport factor 2 family protein [Massilia agilis]